MSSDTEFFAAFGLEPPKNPEMAHLVTYYMALGMFTHAWSLWEYILDLMIATIYHRSAQGKAIESNKPLMLAPKLRYFRKAHASIPELKPYAKLAESIANTFDKMSWLRNTIVHSAQGHTESPLVRDFRKPMSDDFNFNEQRLKIDYRDILKAVKLISNCVGPSSKYAQQLIEIFPEKEATG